MRSASCCERRFWREEYSCSVELCALETDPGTAPQPLALPWVRENSASTALRKIPLKLYFSAISGNVKDTSGPPISGAKLNIVNIDSGSARETASVTLRR